ncbi:hypothetical protein ACS0X5_24845 [Burkholderia gladioli]|nr:hypothetical protein [Burkholderia gladioli]
MAEALVLLMGDAGLLIEEAVTAELDMAAFSIGITGESFMR